MITSRLRQLPAPLRERYVNMLYAFSQNADTEKSNNSGTERRNYFDLICLSVQSIAVCQFHNLFYVSGTLPMRLAI